MRPKTSPTSYPTYAPTVRYLYLRKGSSHLLPLLILIPRPEYSSSCTLVFSVVSLSGFNIKVIQVLLNELKSVPSSYFTEVWKELILIIFKCLVKLTSEAIRSEVFFDRNYFWNFYCYSITVVCLVSPSLHPTPAEPTSLSHLHPPPWFYPCVLYSSSCNPLLPLSPPHSPLVIVRLFLTSKSRDFFLLLIYCPYKLQINSDVLSLCDLVLEYFMFVVTYPFHPGYPICLHAHNCS